MNKLNVFLLLMATVPGQLFAQSVFLTRNGKINFFSKTAVENIDAVNNEVFSVIDIQKGEMAFAVLIKSFRFEKALMEEHFNENYMESDKFPKATFTGKLTNLAEISFQKDGTYPVEVKGELTIHGVTKSVSATGKLTVAGGKLQSVASFSVHLKDYQIEVPSVVAQKIAENIDVSVDCTYLPKER
jgi:polyisoprenoid-binding protein YceI